MPVITENEIRSLATVRATDQPSPPAIWTSTAAATSARPTTNGCSTRCCGGSRDDGVDADTEQDLDRIEEFVRDGFDRSDGRGAWPSSPTSADDLWEVVELPVSVRSELVVNSAPAVGQLEAVVQQATTIGVLAVDKVHARVFVFRLGELIEHTEVADDLGRDYDTVGEHDRGGVDGAPRRARAPAPPPRRRAGVVGAPVARLRPSRPRCALEHQSPQIEAELHPYLRERLHGRLAVEPSASAATIRDATLELADGSRPSARRRSSTSSAPRSSAQRPGRRRARGGARGPRRAADRSAAGLRRLLGRGVALPDLPAPRHSSVARARAGRRWITCADVVEHAVDEALAQSCKVDVCLDNADLDVLGRIGALLRY